MPRRKGDYTRVARRDARQRAWQSMRIIPRFTRPQIESAGNGNKAKQPGEIYPGVS